MTEDQRNRPTGVDDKPVDGVFPDDIPAGSAPAQAQRVVDARTVSDDDVETIPHAAVVAANKTSPKQRIWPAFVAGIVGAVLGLAIGGAIVYNMLDGAAQRAPGIVVSDSDESRAAGETTSVSLPSQSATLAEDVSAKCMDSVVFVTASADGPVQGHRVGYGPGTGEMSAVSVGSGVVLTADGYILTNYHVVEGGEFVSVTTSEGETFEAELVGFDQSSDLAVLKADAEGLVPMEIGSSDDLRVGQWCMTIGYPFGVDDSVAAGIISGLSRSTVLPVSTDADSPVIYANLIQTDASINPGNSGGALVDGNGRLIGICTLYASSTESSANVGFAIPVDYAYRIAGQIMNGETVTHAYLGCSFATVTPQTAAEFDLPVDAGAYVAEVIPQTAAGEAGLETGDIITGFDGERITTAAELIIAVRSSEPGDEVRIDYMHGTQEMSVTVTLGSDEGTGAATGETPDTSEAAVEEQS